MDKIKSSMQSEATMLANNSQHCWMLHVIFVSSGACTPCYMFLRVVACRCLLFLRVPACCCVSLPVAPDCSCVLLGVIAQSLKPVKLLIQRLPPFLFFFFFSFMIAEAGCFLELRKPLLIHFCVWDVGIVQHLFNLLYYVCYTTTWEISANWLA